MTLVTIWFSPLVLMAAGNLICKIVWSLESNTDLMHLPTLTTKTKTAQYLSEISVLRSFLLQAEVAHRQGLAHALHWFAMGYIWVDLRGYRPTCLKTNHKPAKGHHAQGKNGVAHHSQPAQRVHQPCL